MRGSIDLHRRDTRVLVDDPQIALDLLNFAADIFLAKMPKSEGDDHDHRQPYPFIEFKGSFKSGKHNVIGYGGKV